MRLAYMLTRTVQTRGRFPATIYADRTRTWAEVGARVERQAGALAERGVSPTDHVAILALNSDNYAQTFFGIAWAGGELPASAVGKTLKGELRKPYWQEGLRQIG